MPISRILITLAIVLVGAALTIWLAVFVGGYTDKQINPRVLAGALIVALVVRGWSARRARKRKPEVDD
ncbi:MAG: hypothetical protein GKR99_19610 [Rhodobacteraceae bacterium]|nr:hypothetical protein [Paracoccaceae bacterium]